MKKKPSFSASHDADTAINVLLAGSIMIGLLVVLASVIYLSRDSTGLSAMRPAPARAISAANPGPS